MAWETVFIDGFDHYATADILSKWNAGSSVTIDTTIFRNTGRSLRITNTSSYVTKSLPNNVKNVIIGFGYYTAAASTASTITEAGATLVAFTTDLGGRSTASQCMLCSLNNNSFRAARGSVNLSGQVSGGVELGGSAANVHNVAQWCYVECRIYVHDTAGEFEVRVNGIPVINLVGVDTRHQAGIDSVGFIQLSTNAGTNNYYDDVYIRTSQSATVEAGGFLGDVRVKPYYPTSDGTYAQLTPSTGTAHFSLVDESLPSTTDYVSSSTAGQKDTYQFQDMSETGSIKAVQLNIYAAKEDAGFRGIDPMVKIGATEDFGSSQPLSVTPAYKSKIWEKNPNTANDWSQAEFNAAEFGERVSADT